MAKPLTCVCTLAGKLDITPDDPRWIGAWWGGFLLCGALLFFSSLPMFGFPQSLPPRPEHTGESEQAMLPERDYERPKPSNGVLRHTLDGESSTTCFQQLRGETVALVTFSVRAGNSLTVGWICNWSLIWAIYVYPPKYPPKISVSWNFSP